MIIAQLHGGLGNQMFQYAAAKSLSRMVSTSLRVDVSDYMLSPGHNGFELNDVFKCDLRICTQEEIRSLLGWRGLPCVKKRLKMKKYAMLRGKSFVVEPHFHFWKNFFDSKDQIYMCGFWQSEKYFSHIAEEIRNDFEFKEELSMINYEIANSMENSKSVSIHIRRGDYISNRYNYLFHGTCSLEYYNKAIQYIADNVEDPFFYIFSDDMAWVRTALRVRFPCLYVDHNPGGQSHNDMRLMSLCRHHITANSSFSWWGAWLGRNGRKIVVAPERWFRDESMRTDDLCPASWTRL
jgi:hypothetical protein